LNMHKVKIENLWCCLFLFTITDIKIQCITKQSTVKLYLKEVIFETKKWPYRTGDLLKDVQFIW